MNNKLEGTTLIEVILSTFFVSIITILILFSIHSQLKINKIVKIRQELHYLCRSNLAAIVSSEDVIDIDGYESKYELTVITKNISKLKIKVAEIETGEFIEYETYFETK